MLTLFAYSRQARKFALISFTYAVIDLTPVFRKVFDYSLPNVDFNIRSVHHVKQMIRF